MWQLLACLCYSETCVTSVTDQNRMETEMNEKQAKCLVDAMSNRPEIFNVYRFWASGQPENARTWADFLRAAAAALSV